MPSTISWRVKEKKVQSRTENIRFERMRLFKSNEFQAHRLKPLSQFSFLLFVKRLLKQVLYSALLLFFFSFFILISRRLERRTYSYQKYTLPIKLRNLTILEQEHSDLN